MFVNIKKLLPKEINKHGLGSQFTAINVINQYKKECASQLGEDALKNLVPRSYKDKKLHIEATNSAWTQHLHVRQTSLIENINKALENNELLGFSIHVKNNA
jgi:hypothetical protein